MNISSNLAEKYNVNQTQMFSYVRKHIAATHELNSKYVYNSLKKMYDNAIKKGKEAETELDTDIASKKRALNKLKQNIKNTAKYFEER